MTHTTITEALQMEGATLEAVTCIVDRLFDRKTGRSKTGKFWSCQTASVADADTGEKTRITFWGQEPLALASGDEITVTGRVEVKADEYQSNKQGMLVLCLDAKQGCKILDAAGSEMAGASEPQFGGSRPAAQQPVRRFQQPPRQPQAQPQAQPQGNPKARLNQLAHLMLLCIQSAHSIAEEYHSSCGIEMSAEDIRAMGVGLWIESKSSPITATMPVTPVSVYSAGSPEEDGR